MRSAIVLGASLLLLAGCVNATTRYVSPTMASSKAQCSAVVFGVVSSIVVEIAYQNCKKFYEDAGYREVASR